MGYVPYIYCHVKCINKGAPVRNFRRRQNGTPVKMYGVFRGASPWLYISWAVGLLKASLTESEAISENAHEN